MKLLNKLMIITYFAVLFLTSTSFARPRTATAVIPIFAGPRAPFGPTTLIRTPSLDSTVFQSDRIGGNFAYSTIEGHAYTAITPFIQQQFIPTATTIQQSPTFYTPPTLSELSSYDNGNNQQYESQQQFEQQQYDLQRQQYEQQFRERQQYEQQQYDQLQQQQEQQQQQQQQQYQQTYNLYSPNIVRNILFG